MKDVVVHLSFHAWQQYRDRVELTQPLALEQQLQQHLTDGRYTLRRRGFVQIDDVWWVYELVGVRMTLVTCYGRTSMDLPRALGWAARMNDGIDLKNMIWVGGEVECREADREAEEVCRRVPD